MSCMLRSVFTDVDNTLTRYGTNEPYPGALQFLHELRGDMDDLAVPSQAPKVVTLSARPQMPIKSGIILAKIAGDALFGPQLCGKPGRDVVATDMLHLKQVLPPSPPPRPPLHSLTR